jgi:hypothetical protein
MPILWPVEPDMPASFFEARALDPRYIPTEEPVTAQEEGPMRVTPEPPSMAEGPPPATAEGHASGPSPSPAPVVLPYVEHVYSLLAKARDALTIMGPAVSGGEEPVRPPLF